MKLNEQNMDCWTFLTNYVWEKHNDVVLGPFNSFVLVTNVLKLVGRTKKAGSQFFIATANSFGTSFAMKFVGVRFVMALTHTSTTAPPLHSDMLLRLIL